jgi:hypothetical protein|tara:strand:+ start:316 stop:909 length:594 start_codon:yes stop_codon:yes gene_type:complete
MNKDDTKELTVNAKMTTPPPMGDGLMAYMQQRHMEQKVPMPTTVQFDPSEMVMSVPAGMIFLQDAWQKSVVSTIATIVGHIPKNISKELTAETIGEHMADDGDLFFRVCAFTDLQLFKNSENEMGFEDEVKHQLNLLARDVCEYAWDWVHTHRDDIEEEDGQIKIHNRMYDSDGNLNVPVATNENEDYDDAFTGEWV